MRITAKVVADSSNGLGSRVTTMLLEYPRFIHAEFMTHRVFSRNASSSRAIPVEKLVKLALDDPAFFVHVGTNKPGMQAGAEVDDRALFEIEWKELAKISAEYVRRWSEQYGIHKQVANRAMEPWHHIKVIVTATDWHNFFALRDHEAAQPEMRALAVEMRKAYNESEPVRLLPGDWHLPLVNGGEEMPRWDTAALVKASVARSARTSYMNHDGTNPNVEKDIGLHDQLVGATPIHASPAEHQAMLLPYGEAETVGNSWMQSNLRGPWLQYRKIIEEVRFDGRNSLEAWIANGQEMKRKALAGPFSP